MTAVPEKQKPWRAMTPKELVYILVKQENPSLSENTLKTYASQLKAFLTTIGAKSIGGAYQTPLSKIEESLKKVENAQSRASQLNAFISVIKYAKIPMGDVKYQSLATLNDKLREEKMKPMEEGVAESQPDNFQEKVSAYLAKPETKGTREAVFIATMALAPAIRPKQFEDVKIARTQEEYDAFKSQGESVIGVFGDAYKLWTKPANRKVKTIDDPVIYTGKAKEAIQAYIKPTQQLLFPSFKYPTQSVKSQMIEKAIKQAFDDADIGFIGAQKLRRIAETHNQADPSKSRKEKEDFSKQMNHGKDMGDKYRVITDPDIERDEEAQTNFIFWGKTMANISSLMPKIADGKTIEAVNDKLLEALDILKAYSKKPEPKKQPIVYYRGQPRVLPS